MPFVVWVAVALVASVGAVIAFVDLAGRDKEPWLRVAWVAVILSFPIFGPAAYASVEHRPEVLVAWQRGAAAICVLLAAALLFWTVQQVLPPFLIAFFAAALLDPLVTRLQQRGVSRGRAVASIYLLAVLTMVIVVWLVLPGLMQQMRDLSVNASTFSASFSREADRWYDSNARILRAIGMTRRPSVLLTDRSGPVADYLAGMLGGLKASVLGFAGQVIWLIIIPLALFYFLMDFQHLRTGLLALVSERQRPYVDRISSEIVEVFTHYTRSLAIVCALYGATFTLVFTAFRLWYALFLGIAAGALYAVPYVGPAATLGGTLVFSLAMGRSPALVVVTVIVFLAIHVTFDYVITPRVVGGSVGLHPIVNVFALMAGATLFGVWGMLLAVPVAASIQKLLLKFYPGLFVRDRSARPRTRGEEPSSAAT